MTQWAARRARANANGRADPEVAAAVFVFFAWDQKVPMWPLMPFAVIAPAALMVGLCSTTELT